MKKTSQHFTVWREMESEHEDKMKERKIGCKKEWKQWKVDQKARMREKKFIHSFVHCLFLPVFSFLQFPYFFVPLPPFSLPSFPFTSFFSIFFSFFFLSCLNLFSFFLFFSFENLSLFSFPFLSISVFLLSGTYLSSWMLIFYWIDLYKK